MASFTASNKMLLERVHRFRVNIYAGIKHKNTF